MPLAEAIGRALHDANPDVRASARSAAASLLAADINGKLLTNIGVETVRTMQASIPAGLDLKTFDAYLGHTTSQPQKNQNPPPTR